MCCSNSSQLSGEAFIKHAASCIERRALEKNQEDGNFCGSCSVALDFAEYVWPL